MIYNARPQPRKIERSEPCGRSGRHAFSLIELLVVVSVISVLASLIMPATIRAIAESEKTHCKSNLSQLGHSLSLYGNAHEQELPLFGYAPNIPTAERSYTLKGPFWSETMALFLYPNASRNERLHLAVRCPLWTGSNTYYSRGYTCNYGHVFRYYNPGRFSGRGPLHDSGSLTITEIKRPSFVMLLMDGSHGFCYTPLIWVRNTDVDGDGINDTYAYDGGRVPLYNGGAPFRHDGSCMAVFADGHVNAVHARQWLTDSALWDPFH